MIYLHIFTYRAKKELFLSQQAEHLKLIEATADSDDPIEAWTTYIAWARQILLNGGQKQEFATILNDCVRKFSLRSFKDNYKYVRVCTEFVDYCNSPLEFLKWMEQCDIGLCYSVFWETKARVMEDIANDMHAADAAFADGIRRNAQPVDRLQAKRKELHARVAAKMLNPQGKDEEQQQPTRVALGSLASGGMARTARGGPGQLKISSENRAGNAKLQVFQGADEEDDSRLPSERNWIDFGSQREAVKENAEVAKQWAKAKLPQHSSASSRSKPAFDIFDEDHPEDVLPIQAPAVAKAVEAPPPAKSSKAAPKASFAIFSEENDPLFSKMSAPVVSKPAPAAAAVASKAKGPLSPITKASTKERAAFNEAMLKNETLTFEEVRAMQWFEKHRQQEEQRKREAEERLRRQKEKEEEEVRRAREDLKRAMKPVSKPQLKSQVSFALDVSRVNLHDTTMDTMNYEALVRNAAKTANLEALDDLQNVYDDTIDLDRKLGGEKSLMREPTLNTKAVMEEVEKMFSDNLSFNDSVTVSSSVHVPKVAMITSRTGEFLEPAAVRPVPKGDFEVYEDDSLESFRASMNLSAAPIPSKPAPVVAAAPKVAPVSAKPGFAVFCDEDEEEEILPKPKAEPVRKAAVEAPSSSSSLSLDPWSAAATSKALARVPSFPGYVDHGKKKPQIDDGKYLELDDAVYDFSLQLGGGVQSNVYRAENVAGSDGDAIFALKILKPANAWEFYVNSVLARRCLADEMKYFARVDAYHNFADQSMIFFNLNENCTLGSLVGLWKGVGIPEELAILYTLELLGIVELLHRKRILHNDITQDNIIVNLDTDKMSSGPYLQLIDFSCGLDLAELDKRASFQGRGRCTVPCTQMTKGESWCFQQDYFGVAHVVYHMLTGQTMQVQRNGDSGPWTLKTALPSSLRTGMWNALFSELLNAPHIPAGEFEESASFLWNARKPFDDLATELGDSIRVSLTRASIAAFEAK